jgi:predicted phage terminase large subunit-like protein
LKKIEVLSEDLFLRLTPEEQGAYVQWLKRQAALNGLLAYMHHVSPDVKDYPHLVTLCDWIDALLEGRLYPSGPGPEPVNGKHPETGEEPVYNLAIYEPPRHGKSFTVSDHLPAYFTTKFPDLKTHLATYEADFAKHWSTKTLQHLTDPEHEAFFGIKVRNGMNAAKESWYLEGHAGEYKCAGVGGPMTGRGRHLGIADDLIKNAEEASSETIRNKAADWWVTTWWTRREKWPDGTPSREILMNTRWHADDISARVVGKGWAVLSLPALAEDNDLIGRERGDALCPEIMTADDLRKLDSDDTTEGGMGRQWFAALYQQRPYIEGGNLIHGPFNHARIDGGVYHLKKADGETVYAKEAECMRFGVIDLAASVKTSADWTVLGIFDVTSTQPRRIILRHVIRKRMGTDLHEDFVVDGYRQWRLKFVAVEDKTFGTNLINQLRKRGGITVRAVKADTDKIMRAMPLDDLVKTELLWWMGEASWLQTLEEEILQFPNGKHDDHVDVLAYAARIFDGIPQIRTKKSEPSTPEERAAAHIAAKRRPKVRRHPMLGRF